jgi:hypothetical protein
MNLRDEALKTAEAQKKEDDKLKLSEDAVARGQAVYLLSQIAGAYQPIVNPGVGREVHLDGYRFRSDRLHSKTLLILFTCPDCEGEINHMVYSMADIGKSMELWEENRCDHVCETEVEDD